jgi:selenium-binding protein 1
MKKLLGIMVFVFLAGILVLACKQQPTEEGKAQMEGKQPAGMKAEAPQREKLLYVACVDMGGKDPDFVAVVGVDPEDPETYGKIVHRVDMLHIGDELHHFGYNHDKTYLMVPGLFSGRIYIVDVSNRRRPVLKSVYEDLTKESGYTTPHTVMGLENGNNLVTMIGADSESTEPGGVVMLDGKTGKFVRVFGPPADRDGDKVPPKYMYDAGIKPELKRMVTTSFGLPKAVAPGITIKNLGTDVYVWDWEKQKVIQTKHIGAGTGALEVRWRAKKDSTIGYTNAPGSSEIWAWDDLDGDGKFTFTAVIKLPEGSIPTDMLLTDDDKYLYVSNWVGNNVRQYNIEDPLKPELVSEVEIPHAQMLRISPDRKRLYVSNSLLSTWDDTEFPKGVTRNEKYGIFLVDVDHENGGMTLNPDFRVDMMNVQKKNTVGPARPHMMLFDPSIETPFGHH